MGSRNLLYVGNKDAEDGSRVGSQIVITFSLLSVGLSGQRMRQILSFTGLDVLPPCSKSAAEKPPPTTAWVGSSRISGALGEAFSGGVAQRTLQTEQKLLLNFERWFSCSPEHQHLSTTFNRYFTYFRLPVTNAVTINEVYYI